MDVPVLAECRAPSGAAQQSQLSRQSSPRPRLASVRVPSYSRLGLPTGLARSSPILPVTTLPDLASSTVL